MIVLIEGFFEKIGAKFGNLLYYPGCLTRFTLPDIEKNYETILDFLEVEYIKIKEFYCCGSPVRTGGYKDDFYNLLEEHSKILKKYNIKRVVTNCPTCAQVLNEFYHIDAIHITSFLQPYLRKGFLKNIEKKNKKIIYHDSCHLGRGLKLYDEPRKIITLLGYDIVEFFQNREFSLCCGAGGGLKNNFPEISNNVASKKILNAKIFGAEELVTACPMCYKHFVDNSFDDKGSEKIKIFELSQLIIPEIEKQKLKKINQNK